ncbi:TonB-dependent receptor plug domain-containing protein [Sphingobium aquiterrae]|uniref:TonB-dependent receptor plug domain-containing protein n=1 Tax=Sphingobium aquiterrae TaxID=2038656 RepID=UPI0030191741
MTKSRRSIESDCRLLRGGSMLALAFAIGLGMASPLHAQAVAPAAAVPAGDQTGVGDSAPAESGEIVVTASRIARSGFTAPTPTTVVGVEDFQKQAATNVADVLNTMPAFGAGTTPTSTNHTSLNSGANLVDLRNLGEVRTLVLVDGHRFVPATVQGRVDLNVIPTVLIERAEVVTGGASAAWGSDAIAGVVNLIFKKKMTGLEGSAQYGISNYGDGKKYRAALSWGTNFADDRGNFVIAGEWEDGNGIGPGSSRPILASSKWNVIANPNYVLGNGQPRSYLADNVNVSTATLGGLITGSTTTGGAASTILKGTQFLPGGVPAPFNYGTLVGSQYMVGGSPIGTVTSNQLGQLQVPLNRVNVFARASYDVSDAFTLFGEASYARSRTDFYLSLPYDLGTIKINADNAFLPQSIKDTMKANGLASLNLGRISRDVSYNRPLNVNQTQRYLIGAEGKVLTDWKWSAYFQMGQNDYREDVRGNRLNANWRQALDAVVNPANGQIVCRSTLTAAGNGCVPINLFGEGAPSQEAINYVTGTSWQDAVFKQKSAAADISGTPFSLWAGEVSVAAGVEWREESVAQTVDPISATTGWNIHNPKALSGNVNVKEIYGEVLVPLLKDVPFVKNLDLNGAVRYTDYSTSGGVTSWKLGATWEVNDFLRLRATRSRDIRAPALGELFASSITQSTSVIDPLLGNIQYAALSPQQGNRDLKPEIGDTWTAGIVLNLARGFNASIDYYSIKLKDSIGLPAVSDVLDGCYTNHIQTYCDLITRGGGYAGDNERISQILRQYINQGTLDVRGVDFEASYTSNVDNWFGVLDGRFSARLLATYLAKYEQVYNGRVSDSAGESTNPSWRFNATLNYDQGPFGIYLEGRYIGGGHYTNDRDPAGTYLVARLDGTNDIAPQFLLSTSIQYTLKDYGDGRHVQLFATVRNITNNIQNGNPFAYILTTTGNQGTYDIIGRTFAGGVRFKF